ncbi:MAG: DUF4214 domain-containing protein, partial [Pyrinomonadaceae bacterium]
SWLSVLNGCLDPFNTDPASPSARCDRNIVSSSFFRSDEFQLKGLYVYLFYRAAFGYRVADGLVLPAYSEIVTDLRAVTGRDTADLHQKRAAFAEAFVQRPEFVTAYGGLTNQAYVDALLGRYNLPQITTEDPATPEGTTQVVLTRQQLVEQLASGALSRARVLRALVQSDELSRETTGREYNNAFVAMQYYGYLRRTPEENGYQGWLRVLNNEPNGLRTMIHGFLNSPEYQLRFGRIER